MSKDPSYLNQDAMKAAWGLCGTYGNGFTARKADIIAAAASHGANAVIAELPNWFMSIAEDHRTLTPEMVNQAIDSMMAAIEIIPDLKIWELPPRWFTLNYGKVVLEAYLAANQDKWITVAEAKQMLNMSFQAISSMLARGTIRTLPHPNPERNPKQVLLNREDVDAEVAKRSATK